MNESLTVSMSRSGCSRMIAKVVVILGLGAAFGHWLTIDCEAKAAAARALTLEEYTKNFEAYRAGLVAEAYPEWLYITVGFMMALLLFGLYEVLGKLFGVVLGWTFVSKKRSVSGEPPVPTT